METPEFPIAALEHEDEDEHEHRSTEHEHEHEIPAITENSKDFNKPLAENSDVLVVKKHSPLISEKSTTILVLGFPDRSPKNKTVDR